MHCLKWNWTIHFCFDTILTSLFGSQATAQYCRGTRELATGTANYSTTSACMVNLVDSDSEYLAGGIGILMSDGKRKDSSGKV